VGRLPGLTRQDRGRRDHHETVLHISLQVDRHRRHGLAVSDPCLRLGYIKARQQATIDAINKMFEDRDRRRASRKRRDRLKGELRGLCDPLAMELGAEIAGIRQRLERLAETMAGYPTLAEELRRMGDQLVARFD
jgi:hypothetical protein